MELFLSKKVVAVFFVVFSTLGMAVQSHAQLGEIPRTPDGKPDFSGIWQALTSAHWEGDTLVVRVNGQIPDTWFDRAGNHHSWEMVVEESWTYASPNHINYEATITDPNTYTRPWSISLPLYRIVEPNAQLLEFKCVEFAEEYMYGDLRRPGTTREGARPEPPIQDLR